MRMRTKKRLSILVLVVGLPLYIVVAVSAVNWLDRSFGRMPFLLELAVYIVLGLIWMLPFKKLFSGIGRAE